MNNRQHRHHLDEETAGDVVISLKNLIPEFTDIIQDVPGNVDDLFGTASAAIADSVVYEDDKEETMFIINIAKDLGVSIFRNATHFPETYMEIGEAYFHVMTEPSNYGPSPTLWTDCFYTAILSRDEEAIQELIAVPEEITAKSSRSPEVDFAFMRLLKGIYRKDADIQSLVEAAIAVKNYDEFRVDIIFYLNLYKSIFDGDNTKFNHALAEVLFEHKAFHEYEYPNDVTGWISIPIICACIIARTMKGYEIEIESDYVPMWLVTGDVS